MECLVNLWTRFDSSHDKTLLTTDSRSVSYAEFGTLVVRYAGLRIEPGTRIAVRASDPVNCLANLLGLGFAGFHGLMINPDLGREDVEACLSKPPTEYVLDLEPNRLNLRAAVPLSLPHTSRKSATNSAQADVPLTIFTSGSTGQPKAVRLSWRRLWANAARVARAQKLNDSLQLLLNTPPYFTSVLVHFLTTVAAGGTIHFRSGFRFENSLAKTIEEVGATAFGGTPTHVSRLLQCAELPTHFEHVMSSGAHLSPYSCREFLERLPGRKLHVMYGLTELSGRFCLLAPENLATKLGSVGRPIEGMHLTVRDESGIALGPGQHGEVYASGDLVMQGYENVPSEPHFNSSGEFRTGDFGQLDDDGFLWLAGRRDGVFKSGAEKVSIQRITDVLLQLPEIQDAAVIAVEDPVLGQVAAAYLVLSPGVAFNRRDVVRQLKSALPPNHVPRRFVETNSIPRSRSGKLLRAQLSEDAK